MTLNDFCPNNCCHLNYDEATQNLIHKATNKLYSHKCFKYNVQLYHKLYEPWLLKCDQCLSDQQNNSTETNWAIFKDGHRKAITAHRDFLNGDILFSIEDSDSYFLYKHDVFERYDIGLSDIPKMGVVKLYKKSFYRYQPIDTTLELHPLNIYNEDYWFIESDLDHIELHDYKINTM